jgi:hypothetical protein
MSALHTVTNAVLDTLRATSGFQAPTSTGTAVPVYDSTEYELPGDAPLISVVIGYPGSVESEQDGATYTRKPAALANTHPREDEGDILCIVFAQSNDMDLASGPVRALRALADGVVDTIETALRANANLAIAPASGVDVKLIRITTVRHQPWLGDGLHCDVPFTIHYLARLT